ncbi:TolC family protein [Flavobacterium sp. NKUCC04_CG]|uniref:TolC family protein n=1 Tax=Flavobacterium sp. NKUCC04_CG TaxID=2842121 RepID=UPI001C5AFECB|nr:TolC family protein [Flavobacterium sp. NKUCC04_CG]MBW3520099.1 TolC family protein [Flavobacterium sp. NKUCC04_CG]
MKRYLITLTALLFGALFVQAQNTQPLSISKKEAETLFLKQNLQLLATHLDISQAEAQVIQAKLWPNPTLSISEINLWSNSSSEEMPALYRNWGKTSQIGIEIEQLIQTSGKRRKNIALQKMEVEGKKLQFQEVLQNLKLELRNTLTDVQQYQEQQKIYEAQIESTTNLLKSYQNQLVEGNISKSEFIRLKASEMSFRKQLLEIQQSCSESQKDLKIMLNLPAETTLYITDELHAPKVSINFDDIDTWTAEALHNRADILVAKNTEAQAIQKHLLERAMRVPDVTLSANYDRGGNIMRDFVGLGISFELPLFNLNKGNIKEAQIEIDKTRLELEQKSNSLSNEVVQALRNYQQSKAMYEQVESDYEESLDTLLESYLKNFKLRNTSMIEYLDFVEAYLDNKNILLETKKDLNHHFESLQYALGKEL